MKIVEKMVFFSTNKPYVIIFIVLLITIILIPGIFRTKLDNDFSGFVDPDDDVYVTLDYMTETFNINGSLVFISIETDNIYDCEAINFVYKVHTAIEELKEGITEVTSIVNIEDISGKNDRLQTFRLIEKKETSEGTQIIIPKSKEELNLLRQRIESNDKLFKAFIISNIINENKRPNAWNIIIELEKSDGYEEVLSKIENIIEDTKTKESLSNDKFKTYFFGEAYIYNEMNSESRDNVINQVALAILVVCFIYFLNFRSVIGVIFPLLTNLISTTWILSIMGYLNIKLSIVGLLILPLLLAVASSYGIHSLNQYYKESHVFTPKNKKKQITISMTHILKTISLAGLTTIIGISSLSMSSIVHLRTFGIFAGMGVFFAVMLSLMLIPALLSLVKLPKMKKALNFNNDWIDKVIEKIILFTLRNKYKVFVVILLIIIASIIGLSQLSTAASSCSMFVKEHKVRALSDYFSDNFDGISNMSIVIDANPDYEKSAKNEIKKRKDEIRKKSTDNNQVNKKQIEIENKKSENTQSKNTNLNQKYTESKDPFQIDTDDPFSDDIFDNQNDYNEIDVFSIEENQHYNQVLKSDFLKKIDKLMKYASTIEGVGRCYSFTDIIKRFHYIMNNDNPDFEVIPDSDQLIIDYMESFAGKDENSDGLPDTFEKFLNPTKNIIRINMNLKNIGDRFINTEDFRRIKTKISEYIKKEFGTNKIRINMNHLGIDDIFINTEDFKRIKTVNLSIIKQIVNFINNNIETNKIDYYITGSAILFMSIQEKIIHGQFISIIFSLLIIVVITSILFKSPKIGLLSLIPLGTAVIINFGIMGYVGIVLNTATSLISAFAIGIGVDDTIHFILNLRREINHAENNGFNEKNIIYNTLKHTSKAIIFTSLALILGFSVVLFSSFVPVRDFGLLVALTMVNATISTLMFLPSIILIFPNLVNVKKKMGSKL